MKKKINADINNHNINWHDYYTKYYASKFGKDWVYMDDKTKNEVVKNNRPFVQSVLSYVSPPAKLLEAGCGLGRTTISLISSGFKVIGFDRDEKILSIAKENLNNISEVEFVLGDLFSLPEIFPENHFDACTHQGVLEHFPPEKIPLILSLELEVAPIIIFSVPILSNRNQEIYNDENIFRNSWTMEYWVDEVLKDFNVLESKVESLNKDNMICVLKAK